MANIGEMAAQAGLDKVLPKFSMAGMGKIGIILLFIFIGGGIILGLTVWITKRMMYNKNIKIAKRIGNRTVFIDNDKAMLQKIGRSGDVWLVWRKYKKYCIRPQIEQEKNTYWFFIREDGEAINFGLGDIDAQMKEAKAHYIDSDMALSRIAIEQVLNATFDEKGFFKKWGAIFIFVGYMIVALICTILTTNKQAKVAELLGASAVKLAGYCSGVVTP